MILSRSPAAEARIEPSGAITALCPWPRLPPVSRSSGAVLEKITKAVLCSARGTYQYHSSAGSHSVSKLPEHSMMIFGRHDGRKAFDRPRPAVGADHEAAKHTVDRNHFRSVILPGVPDLVVDQEGLALRAEHVELVVVLRLGPQAQTATGDDVKVVLPAALPTAATDAAYSACGVPGGDASAPSGKTTSRTPAAAASLSVARSCRDSPRSSVRGQIGSAQP